MAKISSSIKNTATLREFMAQYSATEGVTITGGNIPTDDESEVNVIWDGDSYYLAYKDGNNIVIDDITNYLPLTIKLPTT